MESVKTEKRQKSLKNSSQPDNTMVYTLAHDIKSPINHVKGLLVLARRLNKDPELEGFLEMAISANQGLSDKVNEMLDMNMREKSLEPVGLRAMVKGIWDQVYRMGEEERMEMIHLCQLGGKVLADRTRFKSILQNILENAIKYRKPDDSQHSVVLRSYVSGNQLIVKVTDNGIGIKRESLEKMFSASFQADKSREGHGMGMYLARKNARHMGGDLEVESVFGEGTTFTLRLPYHPVAD